MVSTSSSFQTLKKTLTTFSSCLNVTLKYLTLRILMKKDTKQEMNHSRNKMKRFPLILNLNRNEIVAGYQQRLHVTYSGQIVSMVINSIRIRLI